MKKYKNDINGFSFAAFFLVICLVGSVLYFALQIFEEKTAEPKFQSLKELTQRISNQINTYYIYPTSASDLDINLTPISEKDTNQYLKMVLPDEIECFVWKQNGIVTSVTCDQNILGEKLGFGISIGEKLKACRAFNTNKLNFIHRICKKESGRNEPSCDSKLCLYLYN